MSTGEEQFFQELNQALGKHPEKEEIIAEYRSHVYEILHEGETSAIGKYEEIVRRLGSPDEIASIWKEEAKVTPKKMQILFVVLNILIFFGGIALTVAYNVYQFEWIELLWKRLTAVPSIIIMVYMAFWGLLGYEIGKEFGSGGLKILRRTFTYAVIPNLLLMYLIVFKLIPHEWFQPLLNGPFILACILLTIVLYPISWIGYRWGRKASV
ncbi:HAAS signaling domain-containing protein [Paucisalibacillus globulus]|uniref:HAAS signaling domain-containing protein n=1 Tax=Paucisalibacillus globulus TaxID=351095 RepID=UPI0003FB442B|nr:membrane protein [Paucisalibacillus globulus]